MNDRINLVPSTMTNKHQFYDNIISIGGEGCVAKDLTSTYDMKGKRAGQWIKLKRTVSQSILAEKLGDTIDAFVTGYKLGNSGTNRENQVSALEFSVYLTDDNNDYLLDETGNPIVHHIATMSGLTDELREILTQSDSLTGKIILNPMFYGKVAEIDGQDISSRNLRFAHAIFKGWRPDRSSDSCKMMKSLLERLIL
jgi:ATP-dependent DNA ligase